jgi:hypothetical protein
MPDKLPFLPDEHHYAIAHVASRAAQLDHQIEFSVFTQFYPRHETSKYLLKNLDSNRLVNLLHALLRDNFKDRSTLIDAMMKDIAEARRERNEILHWLWGKGEDDTIARHGTSRPYRSEESKTKTAQQIYDVAALMLDATIALNRLDTEYLKRYGMDPASLPALPDTPEPPTLPPHSASPETAGHSEDGGLLDPPPPPSPEKSES